MSEADLRRVTEVEIARMKSFGIGMANEDVGIEEGVQAFSSEEMAAAEHGMMSR